jgi:hypothetical protein
MRVWYAKKAGYQVLIALAFVKAYNQFANPNHAGHMHAFLDETAPD